MADIETLVAEFLDRYKKEFDYYEGVCRVAENLLDDQLRSVGVRAIVSSRAKNPKRLGDKIRQRFDEKKYKTVEHIYEDLVDLAGVRIALYFPAEQIKVEEVIDKYFKVIKTIEFPKKSQKDSGKKFSGYHAKHYRVSMKPDVISEDSKRFVDAVIEIQVASVLMHAWSEVEHDLVYKPLQGQLSHEELAILDQLNGLVIAGEMGLEMLQKAAEQRLTKDGVVYKNHYELAASLLELLKEKNGISDLSNSGMGRVDYLFRQLSRRGLNKLDDVRVLLNQVRDDFEYESLVDQMMDLIASSDSIDSDSIDSDNPSWGKFSYVAVDVSGDGQSLILGNRAADFIYYWKKLEGILFALSSARGKVFKTSRACQNFLLQNGVIGDEDILRINKYRTVRNLLVNHSEAGGLLDKSVADSVKDIKKFISRLSAMLGDDEGAESV